MRSFKLVPRWFQTILYFFSPFSGFYCLLFCIDYLSKQSLIERKSFTPKVFKIARKRKVGLFLFLKRQLGKEKLHYFYALKSIVLAYTHYLHQNPLQFLISVCTYNNDDCIYWELILHKESITIIGIYLICQQ